MELLQPRRNGPPPWLIELWRSCWQVEQLSPSLCVSLHSLYSTQRRSCQCALIPRLQPARVDECTLQSHIAVTSGCYRSSSSSQQQANGHKELPRQQRVLHFWIDGCLRSPHIGLRLPPMMKLECEDQPLSNHFSVYSYSSDSFISHWVIRPHRGWSLSLFSLLLNPLIISQLIQSSFSLVLSCLPKDIPSKTLSKQLNICFSHNLQIQKNPQF